MGKTCPRGAQLQGLKHNEKDTRDESELDANSLMADWVHEDESVFIFRGCKNDQTSANANI